MQAIADLTLSQAGSQWLYYLAVFASVIVGTVAVFIWVLFFKTKRRRKRKHHGHGRIRPTLAESGGLPPLREDYEKPSDPPTPFDSR